MNKNMTDMRPATRGANRSCPADYIGGRLHGHISWVGWHGLHRDEVGRDLDDDAARVIPHYSLFISNADNLWHYVHSSVFAPE
jgi:hypothetical protein